MQNRKLVRFTYGQVLNGARLLNVGESGVKVLELSINLLNGVLSLGNLWKKTSKQR